jgi:hypothetical protein
MGKMRVTAQLCWIVMSRIVAGVWKTAYRAPFWGRHTVL